ncbi:HD domain-containing protein [Candidatus Dojkabacteria bacterium]|nr:HD domain-containing protein [Candidatus Dojkabacteria bacterium]
MKIFVSDLKDGDFITEQVFSIEEIQQHKTRTQAPYYRLVLQDKTGEIAAKIWQDDFANCQLRNIEAGEVVEISADVSTYKGQLQITIKNLKKTDDYDITDLLQSSDRDLGKMFTEIQEIINNVQNKHLKKLLKGIFEDDSFVKRYKRSPAAEKVHHDFIGGLMEHTLEMNDISKALLKYYQDANKDLVASGVILHDIGKVYELEVKKTALIRTKRGKLIGHVVQGAEFVKSRLPKDFPEELWTKLEHIIISHQGELALGSPILPSTIEAAIVHYVDRASSQVRLFHKAIKLGEGQTPGFSEYQKWIGTQVYLE